MLLSPKWMDKAFKAVNNQHWYANEYKSRAERLR